MTIAEQYTAERERLELNRALDWSTYSRTYKAAGETLKPLTVQAWFDLLAAKSPILTGAGLTVESIVDYIWRCSIRHTSNVLFKEWRLWWIHSRVNKCLDSTAGAEAVMGVINQHIGDAFDEYPEQVQGGNFSARTAMPHASGEAYFVDELAHRYGVSPDLVLTWNLRKAFQLQKAARTVTNPDYKALEPRSLLNIKSDFLKQQNAIK
jgi:hypothetical protein